MHPDAKIGAVRTRAWSWTRSAVVGTLVGSTLLGAACATPVGIKRLSPQAAYRVQTESALAEERASEPSQILLRRLGVLDRFESEPRVVLAELHDGLAPSGDEDRLFALAELSFLHAERTGERSYFLASAVYAYALLFPGGGEQVALHRADPRLRLAYDLYNHGLAMGLMAASGAQAGTTSGRERRPVGSAATRVAKVPKRGEDAGDVRIAAGRYPLPFGTLEVELDPTGLTWAGYPLVHFASTTTIGIYGLRNHYRRPGIGAPLAASLALTEASADVVGSERIGPWTKVPVTAFLRFENARASLATAQVGGRLEIYAADQASTVTIDGQEQPLEADFSAALAYQLDNNPIYSLEVMAFLRGGFFASKLLPAGRAQDGLFTFRPYSPGKIPIVLVHGTASSPVHWAEMANELEGDPRIRERYQLWFFLYDSGNPIGYSAGRLRKALTSAVAEFDPEGTDPALHRMVVMGHSQGGLLTKLTAIDTGTRLWDRISDKPLDELDLRPETRELLQQSMFYTPLPFVARVVFIATPHRGALLASGRIGAIATRLVRLPTNLLGQVAMVATTSKDERIASMLQHPPTAVDNMNPRHPALRIIASIPVPPETPAHSIIAVRGDGPPAQGDDGVVAYGSAHIDEAVSELVVRSSHSCQGKPETIEEVRRILLEHAATSQVERQ